MTRILSVLLLPLLAGSTPLDDCEAVGGNSCSGHHYFSANVDYNATSGEFLGPIWTNACPYYNNEGNRNSPDCKRVQIGETSKLPSRGNIAWSTKGVNIYGPFEAGFGRQGVTLENSDITENQQPPFPCFNEGKGVYYGYCASGVDVVTCEESLKVICTGGEEDILYNLFLDNCGGHARPYHYHNELACYYNHNTTAPLNGHSPIVGLALDGHAVYGIYESTFVTPTDLDACNGHMGPVPVDEEWDVPTGTTVYHYHTTLDFPFTLGCYGPKDLDACLESDKDCDGVLEEVYNADGTTKFVDTYCSCRTEPSGSLDPARIPEPIQRLEAELMADA
jgi:hypothetical protein